MASSNSIAEVRIVDADAVAQGLPYHVAIDALERAFRDPGRFRAPPRTSVPTGSGTLLMMPAVSQSMIGVKLVTVSPDNPSAGLPTIQASYVLFDGETGSVAAVLDGGTLTAIRTASVSALATTYLAPDDAHSLIVFGAGVQAAAHIDAMRAVRPIDEVVVVSRTGDRARALVERIDADGVDARVGVPEDVRGADLVCTCTTSVTPVFDGTMLPAGSHVNAVGTYTTDARELDDAAVVDAWIVVEDRDAAIAEAGDLVMAFGPATAERIDADLPELVEGIEVRGHHTVFKSVGLAIEDLALAGAGSWAR